MPRISTIKSNKNLRREYRLRFITVFLTALTVACLLVVLSILPSYTLLNFYEKSYRASELSGEQVALQKANENYVQNLLFVHELSKKVDMSDSKHLEVLNRLSLYAEDSVTFSAVEIEGTSEALSVTLRGSAVSREVLLAFEDKMKSDTGFSGFEIPLEVLTKKENISFNVSFLSHEK